MKIYKNIYQTICLTGLLAFSMSSCTEWLTIYPQDRVVEENFWEDKNDLEGVRNGAYRQMASTVSKLVLWGDLRADSYKENGAFRGDADATETHNRYVDIMNGMPDSSMNVFDWGGVYTTINYCNKVLQHGEEVLERDKQFTRGEWIQMRAEMTALRALNYFYLIRAFKDVPYTTKVINKDSEVENFPLMNQLVILDSIINDCERVKNDARNRFADKRDSKGMITKSAIYAMLADMYLWRASLHEGRHGKKGIDLINGEEVSHDVDNDYRMAVQKADSSLMFLAKQNEEEKKNFSISTLLVKDEVYDWGLSTLKNNEVKYCDMIKNDFLGAENSVIPMLEAQTLTFRMKNGLESIFEIQYSKNDGLENSIVNSLFGYSTGTHLLVNESAFDELYSTKLEGDGRWDSRLWVSCQSQIYTGTNNSSSGSGTGSYYCLKYHLPLSGFLDMTGGSGGKINSVKYMSDKYNNWIVYRMTDVMLIEAEAYACLAGTSESNSYYKKAMAICNAIRCRSYCNYTDGSDKPTISTDVYVGNRENKTDVKVNKAVKAVMNERQIELLAEGKRWFDLVRFAERYSSGAKKNGKNGDKEDPRETDEEFKTRYGDKYGYTSMVPDVEDGYTGMVTMVDMYLGTGGNASLATTLKNRFKNRYGLYSPIYEMEVKASRGALDQNPVWNKSKYER